VDEVLTSCAAVSLIATRAMRDIRASQ
jgi:hypothetical protein